MLGDEVYNSLYADTQFRATIKRGVEDSVSCVFAGFQEMTQDAGYGQVITKTGNARVLTANEPSQKFTQNEEVKITDVSSVEYTARIVGIKRSFGLTTLTLEASNA